MLSAAWLIPFLPVLAFAVLALAGGRLSDRALAAVGVVPAGLAAVVALGVAISFLASPPSGNAFSQVLWTWFDAGGFAPRIALYLDPLSLLMVLVVTFVGFLILVYSIAFMRGEEGYRRFFAYMNLFIGSMLVLVLASDFLFLLVGWEGVGLSSFLLIGFWYRDPANGAAARKAFIVTRVGDTALLVGLLLIFTRLGSLDIQQAMGAAQQHWAQGAAVATAAALLVLGGAVGKSAQLPLQTWLPDAMAGPTPVSALIHAATMVTAGVYLVARTRVLFELSPSARLVVAVIGAATLLYAGFSALAQTDIKRALAYSTISQVGYMFLALGVAAWPAAIFHFMTHAFFKALLFLAAGLVIKALDEEHDIRRMGGLRRELPVAFWTFLIGAASLSALPVVTAGFFSKDLVIDLALSSRFGSAWFWAAAVVGALVTSLYSFRLVFLVFFGPRGTQLSPAAMATSGAAADTTPLAAAARATPGTRAAASEEMGGGKAAVAATRTGSASSGTAARSPAPDRPARSRPALGPGSWSSRPAPATVAPVVVLAAGAIILGWLQMPRHWGGWSLVTDFLRPVLPLPATRSGGFVGGVAAPLVVAFVSVAGIYLAYLLFRRQPAVLARLVARPAFRRLAASALAGWGFDRLYAVAFARPFLWLARHGRGDVIDRGLSSLALLARLLNRGLRATQSGRLRYYLATAAFGVLVFVAVGLLR